MLLEKYDYIDYEEASKFADSIIQIMGAISVNLLERVHSLEWVSQRFGHQHQHILMPADKLANHIDILFSPPSIDLGISFEPFQFPEDAQTSDGFNELLSEIGSMNQIFETYYEGADNVPQAWFEDYLDTTLAARFIPLLRNSQGLLMFHGPHFFKLLDHFAKNPDYARLLSNPSGSNERQLSIFYRIDGV